MPAYNFKKQFAPAVDSGEKRQTVRGKRKRPTVTGDTLYLFTGMRTSSCKKLGEYICKEVIPFSIDEDQTVWAGAKEIKSKELFDMAIADGFKNILEFIQFFENQYGLPFEGAEIIKW